MFLAKSGAGRYRSALREGGQAGKPHFVRLHPSGRAIVVASCISLATIFILKNHPSLIPLHLLFPKKLFSFSGALFPSAHAFAWAAVFCPGDSNPERA